MTRHPVPPRRPASRGDTGLAQDGRVTSAITSLAGIGTVIVVGVPVLIAQLSGSTTDLLDSPWWWAAYLLVLVPFGASLAAGERWQDGLDRRVVLPAMTVGGLAAVGLAPAYGFSIALPVITACAGAFIVGARVGMALAIGQTVAIGLFGLVLFDDQPLVAVVQALTFGGFMAFGVSTVESSRQAARGREEVAVVNAQLAATNAELHAAHAQLAASSRAAERLRISRDLHDTIGHQLTALSLQLEGAVHRVDGPGEDEVARARQLTRELLADVRGVVGQLRADDDPRAHAVGQLHRIARSVDRPTVELAVRATDLPHTQDRAEIVVRIVQEGVTNAIRHAMATTVRVEVGSTPGTGAGTVTAVRVTDDGQGVSSIRPGNGLRGMRERVESAGGSLEIRSQLGEGVEIDARVPWDSPT